MECFGTKYEPEGIGSMPVHDCSKCGNNKCVMMSKKEYAYCNDFEKTSKIGAKNMADKTVVSDASSLKAELESMTADEIYTNKEEIFKRIENILDPIFGKEG